MNQQPMLPATLCNHYGHEFVKPIQRLIGQQWQHGIGMINVYRNICTRCDRWYNLNEAGEILEMRD